MGLPRSTFYDLPATPADQAEIVARMRTICDEFESYGYRRVSTALRHQGIVVNGKKVRRLMRLHDLQPRRRRRFVTATDSDHDRPIFPDRAKDMVVDTPNQLWVASLAWVDGQAGGSLEGQALAVLRDRCGLLRGHRGVADRVAGLVNGGGLAGRPRGAAGTGDRGDDGHRGCAPS
jgi:putative transposase